jgi:hypothetical protein
MPTGSPRSDELALYARAAGPGYPITFRKPSRNVQPSHQFEPSSGPLSD